MKTIFTFLLAAIALRCQQPKSQPNLEAETQALRKAADDYQANATPATMDAMKTSYTPNARMMPPGEATVQGTAAVSAFADTFKSVKNFKASFGPPEITVAASGDYGLSVATGTLSYDGEDGKTVTE